MKSWKQWPYWLRGGVIGGGITLLSYVLSISCLYFLTSTDSWGLECLPFAIPWIPFWFVPDLTSLSLSSVNYGIIVVAIWFLAGSVIGATWNHIKNRYYATWPYWLQVTVKIFVLIGIPVIFLLIISYFVPVKSSGSIDKENIIIFQ